MSRKVRLPYEVEYQGEVAEIRETKYWRRVGRYTRRAHGEGFRELAARRYSQLTQAHVSRALRGTLGGNAR